ncbi:MAG: ATP-binding cassette domain-containing protein [Candidatus Bathyarchaeia archaeon]
MSNVVLETENLEKVYTIGARKIKAISDVTLRVNKGDFVAIMGPSGSGKTTLLNLLGCLDRPTDGKVILDGVDVTRVPEKDLWKFRKYKIGFVFQTFNLLPYLSAIENVELPMEGTKNQKTKEEKGHMNSWKLLDYRRERSTSHLD